MGNSFMSGIDESANNAYGSNVLNPDLFLGLNQVVDNIDSASKTVNGQLRQKVDNVDRRISDLGNLFLDAIKSPDGINTKSGRVIGSRPVSAQGEIINIGGKLVPASCMVRFRFVGIMNPKYESFGLHVESCTPLSKECSYISDWMRADQALQFLAELGTILTSYGTPAIIGWMYDEKTCNISDVGAGDGDGGGDIGVIGTSGGGCSPIINVQPCTPAITVAPCTPNITVEPSKAEVVINQTGDVVNQTITCPPPNVEVINKITIETPPPPEDCNVKCLKIVDPVEQAKCLEKCKTGSFKNHLEWMTVESGLTQLDKFVKMVGLPTKDLVGGSPFGVAESLFMMQYVRCTSQAGYDK